VRWLLGLLLALGGPLISRTAAQENRLWFVDLELTGPLEEVVLACGSAGESRLSIGMVAGEGRIVAVPVPARVPLGVESLLLQPLPVVEATGKGAAVVLAWSAEQPTSRVDALVGLRSRPRPPVEERAGAPSLVAAGFALAAFVVSFGLRRRPWWALAAGALGGGVALDPGLLSGDLEPPRLRLHEAEVGAPLGLVVDGARDELALPAGRLEVRPAGRALVLDLRFEAGRITGRVLGPGAELFGLECEPTPVLDSGANAFEGLAECWVRLPGGSWSNRGPWGLEVPLPAPVPGGDPPGWLTAGLPPGRGVLVGHLLDRSGAGWIRVAGFQERD